MIRRSLTKRVDREGRWSEVGVSRDTRAECVLGRKLKATWKGREGSDKGGLLGSFYSDIENPRSVGQR